MLSTFDLKNNKTLLTSEEQKATEFLKLMQKRRSVRLFENTPVPESVLLNAIKAATYAPSAANRQPWHYTLVMDPSTKKVIRQKAEMVEQNFYNNEAYRKWVDDLYFLNTNANKIYLEKSAALIVASLRTKIEPLEEHHSTKKVYYPKETMGISIGILLSALQYSGLSTLTHTPEPKNFLNEIIGLDKTIKPVMIIVVGYPDPEYKYPEIKRRTENEILKII